MRASAACIIRYEALAIADFHVKVFSLNSEKSAMSKSTRSTISDVAKAAKTGKTSISRYLNGEKHLVI